MNIYRPNNIIAKDTASPLFRNQIWTESLFVQSKLFDIPLAISGIYSEENSISYLYDKQRWMEIHTLLKQRFTDNPESLIKLALDTVQLGEEFSQWSYQKLFETDLSKKSNNELLEILRSFREYMKKMYAYGIILPLLDYQELSFVEDWLQEFFIQNNIDATEQQEAYEILTYPARDSYSIELEKKFFELLLKYIDIHPALVLHIKAGDVKSIEQESSDFFKKYSELTNQYAWLYYSFMGPAYEPADFLPLFAQVLPDDVSDVQEYWQKHLLDTSNHKEKRQEVLNKYAQTEKERKLLDLIGILVWAKPRRKEDQSRNYYYAESLLSEIGTRIGLTLDAMRSTPIDLIIKGLENKQPIDPSTAEDHYSQHICLQKYDKTILTLSGDAAQVEFKKISSNILNEENQVAESKELSGRAAFRGVACGTVKVINTVADIKKMEEGDILVSVATTPQIVLAMKQAAAFVTDEGGLTCHAAIVSRELKKPCIVGTKIATEVLKDGDEVEVDANEGVVKIIKKANE